METAFFFILAKKVLLDTNNNFLVLQIYHICRKLHTFWDTTKYNDNVGKIPTGATIKITKEGGLNIDFHGFGGLVRLFPDYGWVNKKWQRKQQKAGDHSWNKLFEIAGQIGRRPY